MKPKVGMRVLIFSPDRKKLLGAGEIITVDNLIVEETGELLDRNFPTLRLDNGKKIDGLHCWWKQVSDDIDIGDCEECEKKNIIRRRMSGWSNSHGDGKECYETDVIHVCLDCYKKKMKSFGDSEEKMAETFYEL
jgi:hypothetical protein